MALSLHGKRFTDVAFQVDTAATCSTIPYDLLRRLARDCDLCTSTLVSYAGESIKPSGKLDLICDTGTKRFDVLSFEVVNLPGKPALLGLSDSMRPSLSFPLMKGEFIALALTLRRQKCILCCQVEVR